MTGTPYAHGLRARIEARLQRLWFSPRGALDRAAMAALWPWHALHARHASRRRVPLAQRKAQGRPPNRPPVVVVGNLVVGGTGKTPLLIALAEALRARGWRPGILASGYGSAAYHSSPRVVQPTDCAAQVGDEALLISRRTGLPLVVGRDRGAGLAHLHAASGCDVVLSDDGLQHLRLPRDLELAVFDARGAGNGRCLPAGPLREPLSSALLMDALLLNGTNTGAPVVHSRVFPFTVSASEFLSLDGQVCHPAQTLAGFVAGRAVHAVAGLGAPQRFFDTLQALGVVAHGHVLADHAPINPHWLAALGTHWLIMTEKDAVKCPDLAPALQARCLVLRVKASLDVGLIDWLEGRLRG